jgi:hypothetical protein
MSVLAKVQQDFCHFIRGHGHENFMRHMKSTDIPKERLLNIYHNNIFSVHHRSLELDYPFVFSILGDELARQMVHDYVEVSLPCMASLSDWGAGFISFIQRNDRVAQWPYLQEIAQFEWSKHIAYGSPEDPLLTKDDMKKLVEAEQKEIRFQFQKSCQLLAFHYPIQDIMDAHDQGKAQRISQLNGSSYALVVKHQGLVKVYWLTAALFAFINRLMEGQDMEVAYAAAQVLDSNFDAQEAFQFLFDYPILHR